jgi:hypothetical protein
MKIGGLEVQMNKRKRFHKPRLKFKKQKKPNKQTKVRDYTR